MLGEFLRETVLLLDDTWPPSDQWECVLQEKKIQGPVVRKMDSTIRLVNLYLEDSAIGFPNTYPLDRDLSDGAKNWNYLG